MVCLDRLRGREITNHDFLQSVNEELNAMGFNIANNEAVWREVAHVNVTRFVNDQREFSLRVPMNDLRFQGAVFALLPRE